jgi:hypothetical protein
MCNDLYEVFSPACIAGLFTCSSALFISVDCTAIFGHNLDLIKRRIRTASIATVAVQASRRRHHAGKQQSAVTDLLNLVQQARAFRSDAASAPAYTMARLAVTQVFAMLQAIGYQGDLVDVVVRSGLPASADLELAISTQPTKQR